MISKERQGEIAVKMVKLMMERKGLELSPNLARELGNIAKTINVPLEELKEFVKPIMQEMLDNCMK